MCDVGAACYYYYQDGDPLACSYRASSICGNLLLHRTLLPPMSPVRRSCLPFHVYDWYHASTLYAAETVACESSN